MEDIFVSVGIPLAQFLTILGVIIAALAAVFHTITNLQVNPTETIKGLGAVIAFILILVVIYFISPGDTGGIFQKAKYAHIDGDQMQWIEAGITSSMFLVGGALIIGVVSEVINAFK